ncbi:MAG TPA: oligoendopeptidase F [Thermomicrobiales bacterium]|nr:oligoendopeptidase F [Thermomicrobiales bacterium]
MADATMTSVPTRDQIAIDDTWDLSTIYATDDEWEVELGAVESAIERAASYHGRLGEGAGVVAEAMEAVFGLHLMISRLAVYASLRRDEDTTSDTANGRYQRAIFASIQAGEALSFLEPEILALPADQIDALVASDTLQTYRHLLEDLQRRRAHVRSEEVETVLAQLADVTRASSEGFSALDNADLQFGSIVDENGNEVELSKARYGKFLESLDRDVRQRAYESMSAAYASMGHTIASLYGSSVRKDVATARVRGYETALEEALFDDNVPASVYHGLLTSVQDAKPLLERSLNLRKRALGLDELRRYDLRVPLGKESQRKYDYREAVDIVLAGVGALGERYAADLGGGFNARWVDVHETRNKRSGAYSWGVYGAPPVMLMNWNGTMYDVFTLAHEAGHAMHTFYSNSAQPFHKAHYPIFLAEVASTVNEVLLTWRLLDDEMGSTPAGRLSLLDRFVSGFEGTVVNQAMYADFEVRSHGAAEDGQPITLDFLNEQFGEVQGIYGPGVVVDDTTRINWARVPHFYRAFYVYQYATGLIAAINLARAVRDEGEPARLRYLELLSSGGSDYPLELLRKAGVDLTGPEATRVAFEEFGSALDEIERLLDEGALDA